MINSILTATDGSRISLAGAMDADGARTLRPLFENMCQNAGQNVALDLNQVTYLDGSGVGAIAFAFKRLAARGLQLTVAGASGQPLAMLRRLGLDSILGLPAPVRSSRFSLAGALGFARAA